MNLILRPREWSRRWRARIIRKKHCVIRCHYDVNESSFFFFLRVRSARGHFSLLRFLLRATGLHIPSVSAAISYDERDLPLVPLFSFGWRLLCAPYQTRMNDVHCQVPYFLSVRRRGEKNIRNPSLYIFLFLLRHISHYFVFLMFTVLCEFCCLSCRDRGSWMRRKTTDIQLCI